MDKFLTKKMRISFSLSRCLEIAERNGWKRDLIIKELRVMERTYMIKVLNLIDKELGKHPYTSFLEQAVGKGFSEVDWDSVANHILDMAEYEDAGGIY